jgi:outer membrane protein
MILPARQGGSNRDCWRRLASTLLMATAAVGCAQLSPASAESLKQALASTYQYNPLLDAQRATLRATDENVPIARSGYLPQISAEGTINYQNTHNRPDTSGSNGSIYPQTYKGTISENLFNGFQTYHAVNAAEATVRSGRETLRDTERTVLLQAVTAYMDVVRDSAIIGLQESNVQVLSRELKATQDRFSVGEVTKTDVAQAQARRAGAVSQLDLARANLRTSRATFEQVVGHPPSNLRDQHPPEKLLPKALADAIGVSVRENPLVLSALYKEEAARYTVDQIRGQLLPSLDVTATIQDTIEPSKFIAEQTQGVVTGRLTVPLYEGGRVYAQVRQAKHQHVAALQVVEQTRTQVQQAVTQAWSQLQAARAQLESDRTQVNANRTALAGVREEERVGQRTLLDVLNAEQEYLNSQVNLITDKRNLVVSAYTLLSQIGRLDAAYINVADNVYDPVVHYEEVRRKWFGLDITHGDGHREHFDTWNTRTETMK